MSERVDLSPLAVRKALALGAAGRAWVESLPDLVAECEARWEITVGAPIGDGSTSYVAAATTADGSPAVLKLAMPDGPDGQLQFDRELWGVELGQGRGYVKLLRSDPHRRVMLQERLGRTLASCGLSVEARLDAIAATVARAWQPSAESWRTGADQAESLRTFVRRTWSALGAPCAEGTIVRAEECALARRDAFDRSTAVVIHGDAHEWNLLEDGSGGFKMIDPDAMLSHPAHELAIPIRHLMPDHDAVSQVQAWCQQMSAASGASATDIWEWAFLERVSTGLFLLHLGDPGGQQYLAVADQLAAR